MRSRKRKVIGGKITFLYISLILSLSLMGVGYAAWNESLTINTTISTGNAAVAVRAQQGRIDLDNGNYLDIRVEDNELKVEGRIYPSFSESLAIDILDIGTVPVILKSVDEINNHTELVSLDSNSYYTLNNHNLGQNQVRESFNLNINPYVDHLYDYDYTSSETLSTEPIVEYEYNCEEIEELSTEIWDLRNRLDNYLNPGKYEFRYNLLFEQAF